MNVFTYEEIDYLKSQIVGRIAPVESNNQPHVVPVSFRYDADFDTIHVGGHNFRNSKKFYFVRYNSETPVRKVGERP